MLNNVETVGGILNFQGLPRFKKDLGNLDLETFFLIFPTPAFLFFPKKQFFLLPKEASQIDKIVRQTNSKNLFGKKFYRRRERQVWQSNF